MQLSTPVALMIFNRPEHTERVFREIARARPSTLLVVADGPRAGIREDIDNCRRARQATERVDWDCEVRRNYSDKNLGCRRRMASGLDWVFLTVEEAIILEDDCLPNRSFFRFCEELLSYYRDDTRIMQICGTNVLKDWNKSGQSYFFSAYGPVWGWASWRRAWKHYDVDMKLWPEIRRIGLYEDIAQNKDEAAYRRDLYDKVFRGEIDTWDYQWGFAKMINTGYSIVPQTNMIANIGFGPGSTHTASASPVSNLDTNELAFPLEHPPSVTRDRQFDLNFNKVYLPATGENPFQKLISKLAEILS